MLLCCWQIADTFTTGFDLQCIIDEVLRGSDDAGVVRDDIAEVRAHFIDDNNPVPVEDIEAYVFSLNYTIGTRIFCWHSGVLLCYREGSIMEL